MCRQLERVDQFGRVTCGKEQPSTVRRGVPHQLIIDYLLVRETNRVGLNVVLLGVTGGFGVIRAQIDFTQRQRDVVEIVGACRLVLVYARGGERLAVMGTAVGAGNRAIAVIVEQGAAEIAVFVLVSLGPSVGHEHREAALAVILDRRRRRRHAARIEIGVGW